ncbi:Tfp pilus assembly protein FimT/FimU [Psychrobacter sp. FDAARGOS_221]|uniref:pilus assembly FimT family protein n=1 Tax=Psychrobacter sp. FDAARGOS_221 TaxID=1975705 RepID=UPI000BB53147|nr:prepilin-type N-terminal cleavage/methylation domain-containing protein [Psychrobacter sp. FDAARGOS_221]PNK60377.1 prepilin-type N-terminal cleavage/methylation domain-containing protein [Psychrobacter sp. FDAARGOS_221]
MPPTCDNHNIRYSAYQSGFSLLETLITVAIIALMGSIAIPSFINSLKGWEANQIRSHITNAIRTAKIQSRIQRQNTIMCFANEQLACHKQANAYLLVFVDTDNSNTFTPNSDRLVLKQAMGLDYGQIYLRAANRHYIKFYGDSGLPRGHFGHIKYCPNNADTQNMYQVSINQQGNHRFKPYDFKKTGCPN